MCGFTGYYGFEKNKSLLKTMNDAQAHRGPDGEGFYLDDEVGFGHLRLAIIDRAGGAQPMKSADGNVIIAFNGEIYNFLELRTELEALGHTFKTESDTEVIVESYLEWGDDCFDKFNGMFTIAIRDLNKKRFLLARDHFGIKPVYFSNLGTDAKPKLIFASEIKAILASGLVKAEPNDTAIYRYLKFRIHDEADTTFFKNIYSLNPGELLVIDSKGLARRPFTTLIEELRELSKQQLPYTKETAKQYQEKLIESVRSRLQSEVPVGTSLSGGLDSSAVATIINQLIEDTRTNEEAKSVGAQQNTFSAIFPGSMNDEESYVDAALEKFEGKVISHKIKPTADEFYKDLKDFIRTQEEPIISSGPYAQYQVMREAQKHVTVLLDGQGADEMMAGYVPYYFVYLKQLKANKQWGKLMVEVARSSDVLFRLARFRLQDKLTNKKRIAPTSLFNTEFMKLHSKEKFVTTGDNLKERLIEDLFHNSLPSLLRYEDKNTMRFSLEGRVPFLDKEVVKFLFAQSDEAIIHHGWNKRILRDAMKNWLPDVINWRRNKIGFTTPENEWFIRLKNRFYNIFLSESFANRPYFNAQQVAEAFEGFIKGKNDTTSMLFWRIVNVELWLQEFIDEKVEEVPVVVKTDLDPNGEKNLDIAVGDETYRRYPIRTEMISSSDAIDKTVTFYVDRFFETLKTSPAHQKKTTGKWYVFVSEKIIAIMQGRSYFIWDIKVSWWARTLSKFVTKTPYGIGLGSPWTMELAIREVGLARILYASTGGFIGKLIGKRGVFYNLVGENVRAIDGPTEYSVYPSNVSAKLPPKNPNDVAKHLSKVIREKAPADYQDSFAGTIVMDANDIGRNVLGKDAEAEGVLFEEIFGDNPLGQADEQTPIAIVFKQD